MRYLLVLLAVTLQGCATGLLHSGVAKRPFPIVTPEMTLDYHPPKQIGSYPYYAYWQFLYIPDSNAMTKYKPQDIMAQVCQLFPEFNPKTEMQVYTGISRREDVPGLLSPNYWMQDWMLRRTTEMGHTRIKPEDYSLFGANDAAQLPDVFRKAWTTRWFVYMPPNRIYINLPPGMLTQEDDNLIYLLKKPCK